MNPKIPAESSSVWRYACGILVSILLTGLVAWMSFGDVKRDVQANTDRLDRVEDAMAGLTDALHGVQVESAVLARELSMTRESLRESMGK